MKKWNTLLICLFTVLCIILNLGGKMLASEYQLMFWLDSFGTVLCAYVGGPVCGCIVGATTNLLCHIMGTGSVFYMLTSVAMGIIVGLAAKKDKLSTFFGTMETASLVTLIAVVVSVPLNLLFANGKTGNLWGDGVIGFFHEIGCPHILACVLGQAYIDFADKTVTLLLLFACLMVYRRIISRKNRETVEQSVEKLEEEAAHPELVQMVGLLLAFCISTVPVLCGATAKAENASNKYNDYVKTVYSSSNGLPCGKANDIEETHDGIIWIGTYAGLYRYNGTEFRQMDNYDSVRNVNCLYVDEEGRLWIGTNDNGLSIAIDETIVNVIDQDRGLPANSVRSIIKSSDGYFYIGTTGSMQILTLNSGLKKVNTLSEIIDADSSCADENGHVVCITSDGLMFLMSRGQIQSSIRLIQDKEKFSSCIFDEEGMLLAGTSSKHIYRYDIRGGGFERIGEITCEGIKSIKDMEYLDSGTLFITSDSGIGYLESDNHFYTINTNEFDNSIDHMLVDYQGNFWFTSSRLGLLRMAQSSFMDVYSNIGMDSQVVNAVEMWQGDLYFGTDEGLDAVDAACTNRITNKLTKQLAGTRIRTLRTDEDGALWIGTKTGLFEVEKDGSEHEYNAANGLFGDHVRTITQLRNGTVAAAGDGGVSFIQNHEILRTVRHADGLVNSKILTLIEQNSGRILAGTDGGGISVIENGEVVRTFARADGLSSDVILRLVQDPKTDGFFVVTSNGLCYVDEEDAIRKLDRFPYFNNYDIWVKDADTLYVMSSAGIYIVDRDILVDGVDELSYELLNSKRGLNSALTPNAWIYENGNGVLYLPCDTGVYVIDTEQYNSGAKTYRMSVPSMRLDKDWHRIEHGMPIHINRSVSRIELYPEIINYTIQDPNTGYRLDGFDTEWKMKPQSELNSIVYTNLPTGEYTLHLAVFDNQDNILEERQYSIIKDSEIYDKSWFVIYIILVAMLAAIWFAVYVFSTHMQRQMEIQQREIAFKDKQLELGNQTILAIANTVDAKDVRTSQHSLRVALYSKMIGKEYGLSDEECDNLEKAARLHDIGKIGIPDRILNKDSRLTDEEYREMKTHVTRGAEILKGFTLIAHAADGAMYHHERYDGRGYPKGLKGEEIPLYGRIIGVADAFDAMTANRVYRKQMDFSYVLNEMLTGRGTQFDPQFVDILLKLIDDRKIDLNKLYPSHTEEKEENKDNKAEEKKEGEKQDG